MAADVFVTNVAVPADKAWDNMAQFIEASHTGLVAMARASAESLTKSSQDWIEELPAKSVIKNDALLGDKTLQTTVLSNRMVQQGLAGPVGSFTKRRGEVQAIQQQLKILQKDLGADGLVFEGALSSCKEAVWHARTCIGASASIEEVTTVLPTLAADAVPKWAWEFYDRCQKKGAKLPNAFNKMFVELSKDYSGKGGKQNDQADVVATPKGDKSGDGKAEEEKPRNNNGEQAKAKDKKDKKEKKGKDEKDKKEKKEKKGKE